MDWRERKRERKRERREIPISNTQIDLYSVTGILFYSPILLHKVKI